MTTSLFQTSYLFGLPRPDRVYRRLCARRQAKVDHARVASILDAYGLRVTGEPSAPPSAGRSQNLIFETAAGKKMLKRYKGSVELDAVRHEHSILLRLAELSFPAPRLAATMTGDTLVQRDDGCYALFDFLEGYFQYHNYVFPPSQTRRFVAAAGATLGTLHAALADFTPAGRNPNGFVSREGPRWRELSWFAEKLDQSGRALSDTAVQAAWVAETLRDLDTRLASAALPRLIVHGDYGPYNLLFKRGAPVVVLDFELARLDWRLTDLATALGFFARGRLGFNVQHAASFLEAYVKCNPAEDAELRWLPEVWLFLTLRRLIVCWYRYATTRAHEWRAEAERRVELARWITANSNMLSELL